MCVAIRIENQGIVVLVDEGEALLVMTIKNISFATKQHQFESWKLHLVAHESSKIRVVERRRPSKRAKEDENSWGDVCCQEKQVNGSKSSRNLHNIKVKLEEV